MLFLDIETTGLERDSDIIGTAWATKHDSGWCDGTQQVQALIDQHPHVIFHNASFDVPLLERDGIDFTGKTIDDTMLMSYLLEPGGKHSLGSWGERLGFPKLEYDWNGALDMGKLVTYAIRDVELTRLLAQNLCAALKADTRLLPLYTDIERPYLRFLIDCKRNGMRLDMAKLHPARVELALRSSALLESMLDMAPRVPGAVKEYVKGYHKRNGIVSYSHCDLDEFNPGSGDDVAWVLESWGWCPTKKTPTGKPKTDSETLSALVTSTDPRIAGLSALLVEHSEVAKVLTAFLAPLERMVDDTGHVYPDYNQCVTLTGRLSASKPNTQQIPSKGVLGALVRGMFIPEPGCLLVDADLAAVEARVLAHYLNKSMGDDSWTQNFAASDLPGGADFHTTNATAWGVSRPDAKTLLYGCAFGAGPTKLGGGDVQRGKMLLASLESACPALPALKAKVWDAARKRGGTVYDAFGRRGVYPGVLSRDRQERSRAERQAFNFLLQGTAASLLKKQTVAMYPELCAVPGYVAHAPVHDEVISSAPIEHAEQVRSIKKRFMSDNHGLQVPIACDVRIGPTWNDTH